MINLFNINNYKIDTSQFSNFLHDSNVQEFENKIADYVGAKYACSINSATNAIFLALLNKNTTVNIPSVIPPVVLNAILTSNNKINFVDNVSWVGDSYILHRFEDYKIIDSAQKLEKDQFKKEANDEDLMIFSFYPTKPVGSCDGGMIVSNDENKIKWFKQAVLNGMEQSNNNWEREIKFPGYKMYMNSIQATIALENFKVYEDKLSKLNNVLKIYNDAFELNNTSYHLYRINVNDNSKFIAKMKENNIVCGIHYAPMHLNKVYSNNEKFNYPLSEAEGKTTVSIPFHEKLDESEIYYIIERVKEFKNI